MSALREFDPKDDPSVEVIVGEGDAPVSMEAHWIARRIRELVGSLTVQDGRGRQRPARFRDVAVLVRTLNALAAILEALQNYGVPFLHEGGKTFYETREVRDLVLLLRVIANPPDEIALAGVLRSPLVGVGDETLLRMKLAAAGTPLSGSGGSRPAAPFRRPAGPAARRARRRLTGPAAAGAMDECDYEGGLDSGARANVDKFLALVRGLVSQAGRSPSRR